MKKLLLGLIAATVILLLFGCSDSQQPVAPSGDSITLVQRPQFIETRPEAVVLNAVVKPTPSYVFEKKPPKPPPDTGSADPNPDPAHKYAYIVGIADYEGTINDLQYPDDDALEVKSMLQGEGFTIRSDLNRSATADNIAAGLQWLASSAQPGDEIAFYYSGHGAKAPSYGSSLISTDLYYITHGYVMQIINSTASTKNLVAMDACVLGDFHSDVTSGMLMATASTNSDSYDAPDLKNGAWTYFFLEAHEDLGMIYGEDVATYAEAEMRAWAKPYRLRVSPKHTDRYTGMFDM